MTLPFSVVAWPGKSPARRVVLAAFCFGCAISAQAAMTLHIRLTTHVENSQGNPTARPDNTQEVQVIVGDHYLSVKSGTLETIFDFVKRRRYAIDLKAARYVDYSLFDTVGFRVTEMQSRQGLVRALAAIKLASTPVDVVYNEQALSVIAVPGEKLDATVEGGELIFAIDGKTLLRRSSVETPVGAHDAAGLATYLRYTAGGHPLVLDQLAGAHAIPAQWTLSFQDAGSRQTRRYELVSAVMEAPAN